MNVTQPERNYYVVSDGEQRYAVAKVPGGWVIANHLGDQISELGVLGNKILAGARQLRCGV